MKTTLLSSFALACTLLAQASPVKVLVLADSEKNAASVSALLSRGNAVVLSASDADSAEVLVLAATQAQPAPFAAADRQQIEKHVRRGGGLLVLGSAVGAGDPAWFKALAGGAWKTSSSKFADRLMWCPLTDAHPITASMTVFDVEDEALYDLETVPEIQVLASTFTPKVSSQKNDPRAPGDSGRANVFDIQPQMWAYEASGKHRAVVLLQGGEKALEHPSIKAAILRSIAWSAKRPATDDAWPRIEPDSLRYPKDGARPAAETVKSFELHPEFQARVIAAEPLINKPIAIQWDAKGRLWVAETIEYPNGRRPLTAEQWKETGVLVPGQYKRPARDRISILSEPDANGVFTKKTVFHEGLELITGFCLFGDGAVVVGEPDIVFLHDCNGDDKADAEERIFTGFTPPDTHFVTNHFIAAPDGWIYADTGSGPEVGSIPFPDVKAQLSSGIFRFKPDGSAIEQVSSRRGNSFGGEFTSDGEIFFNQATTGNPVQHVVLPEKVLAKGKVRDASSAESVIKDRTIIREDMPDRAPLMQIDQVGRFSAACASSVYEGGSWPPEWTRGLFTTEPILDIIHHERLVPAGPTFKGEPARGDAEWLRSKDHWFFPVAVEFGPDGAMYVLDFYCPVVAHSDTRGPQHSTARASIRPDRDHYFGRIYRIDHQQAAHFPVPDLSRATPQQLVAAFTHPNKHIRFTAHRLLMERTDREAALPDLIQGASGEHPESRMLALWALCRLGKLDNALLFEALKAPDARVRKTGLHIAATLPGMQVGIASRLQDGDARVRLVALSALAECTAPEPAGKTPGSPQKAASAQDSEVPRALLRALEKMDDDWSRSAALAAASADAVAFLEALLAGDAPATANGDLLAQALARQLAERGDARRIAQAVHAAARASRNATATARLTLETLCTRPLPGSSAEESDVVALLQHPSELIRYAALPFASAIAIPAEGIAPVRESAIACVGDASRPEAVRVSAARGLARGLIGDASVRMALTALLCSKPAAALASETIQALSQSDSPLTAAPLLEALAGLAETQRTAAFDVLVSRPGWAAQTLDAVAQKRITPALLGPARLAKLTGHADRKISKRAREVLDVVGAGSSPEKNEIIERLLSAVEAGTGDAARGKTAFATACSVCHIFAGEGKHVGPPLDGIGVHGTHELLIHILDPSRVVDQEHWTWNFALKNGSFATGILAAENETTVTLTLPGGLQQDLRKADIQDRRETGASLMPEGFESLGADTLRDILVYLSGGDARGRFRAIPLLKHFTTDTLHGVFGEREEMEKTIHPVKFGVLSVEGVPFTLPNPAATPTGGNVLVLRGGARKTFTFTMPQRVEIPVGFAAGNLHFLGGVAGWGGGPGFYKPAMKVTIEHENGRTQVEELETGKVFTDYTSTREVPGSKRATGVVQNHHVRYFALPVADRSPIKKLVLESYQNHVCPATLAITADREPVPAGRGAAVPSAPSEAAAPAASAFPAAQELPKSGEKLPEQPVPGKIRALVVGGGSSHDFEKFFHTVDGETLRKNGRIVTAYTANLEEALSLLPRADALVLTANHKQFGTPPFQQALNAYADSGRGLVIVHAGVWYNWAPVSGYNKRFVGGGSRSHGRGEFKVFNRLPEHPVMKGVAAEFLTTDEHYRSVLDAGTDFEMLAETGEEQTSGKRYPAVWVVKDKAARIVNISLGHGQDAHGNPAYQTLLENAVRWVAEQ